MNDAFLRGFQDELEKEGFLGSAIIGGAAGHLATNIALGRAMRGKRFMPDILRAGFKHGQQRRKLAPFRETMVRQTLGPEIPHVYHEARGAGRLARVAKKAKTPESKQRLMRLLQQKVKGSSMPEIQKHIQGKTPEEMAKGLRKIRVELAKLKRKPPSAVTHPLRAALRERTGRPLSIAGRFMYGETGRTLLKGKKPVPVPAHFKGKPKGPVITAKEAPPEPPPKATVHEKYRPSKARKAIYAAGPAAVGTASALAGVPGAAKTVGHLGINIFRDVASRSARGKSFVKSLTRRGIEGKALPGETSALSLALSPGVAQLQEAGTAVGKLRKAITSRQPSPKPLAPAVVRPSRWARPGKARTTAPTP